VKSKVNEEGFVETKKAQVSPTGVFHKDHAPLREIASITGSNPN
jgi:hypothetical protein